MRSCRRRRLCRATIRRLMFTNAGMVQFKNVFTGQETRPYNAAATSQKCVRAGGKHNDLDNVGYTARHHTVLRDARQLFLRRLLQGATRSSLPGTCSTQDFGIPAEKRLRSPSIHTTTMRAGLWHEADRLGARTHHPLADNDNFWQMGDTGPCGPCSEIYYDHGAKASAPGPPGLRMTADGGPVRRDLEPRVHAVRPQIRTVSVSRLPKPLDRYRHGAGTHSHGAAGQA